MNTDQGVSTSALNRKSGARQRSYDTVSSRRSDIGITGVLLSPILLSNLSSLSVDWPRLSEVGQAYGAASALLST
jgi:hypothetical protein